MEDQAIIRLNIEHYRRLMKQDLNVDRRQTVTTLLAECECRLSGSVLPEDDAR